MRRRIAIILLLLASGAMVNVAVAWGCVLKHPPLQDSAGDLAQQLCRDFFGYPAWRESSESDGIGYRQQRAPVRFERMLSHGTWRAAVGVEAGWPFLALCGAQLGSYGNGELPQCRRNAAIVVHSKDGRPRILPLRPQWAGFSVNTLLYALLLWLIFFASFAVRRMIRRRRWRCAKCAYPIGVSPVCTECGAAVEAASRAPGGRLRAILHIPCR